MIRTLSSIERRVRWPLAGAAIGLGVVLGANATVKVAVDWLLNSLLLDSGYSGCSGPGYRRCALPGYPGYALH